MDTRPTRAAEMQAVPPAPATRAAAADDNAAAVRRRAPRGRLVWAALAVLYLLHAFAFCWPAAFENRSHYFAVAGLLALVAHTFSLHVGLLLTIAAIDALVRRQWRMLAALVPLALWTAGPDLETYLPRTPPAVTSPTFKVVTANLYEANGTPERLADELASTAADVICLQEYTPRWHAALSQRLGREYAHVATVVRDDPFGIAVCSRRPFVEPPRTDAGLGDVAGSLVRATVDFDGRRVNLFNVHLLPPRSVRMHAMQRRQFAELLHIVNDTHGPVVLVGDFNFPDRSAFGAALRRLGFAEAYSQGGWGRGATWPVNGLWRHAPGVRIDHLWLRGGLACRAATTGVGEGSDHRPTVAVIGFLSTRTPAARGQE